MHFVSSTTQEQVSGSCNQLAAIHDMTSFSETKDQQEIKQRPTGFEKCKSEFEQILRSSQTPAYTHPAGPTRIMLQKAFNLTFASSLILIVRKVTHQPKLHVHLKCSFDVSRRKHLSTRRGTLRHLGSRRF
jgi:hypothetical protein